MLVSLAYCVTCCYALELVDIYLTTKNSWMSEFEDVLHSKAGSNSNCVIASNIAGRVTRVVSDKMRSWKEPPAQHVRAKPKHSRLTTQRFHQHFCVPVIRRECIHLVLQAAFLQTTKSVHVTYSSSSQLAGSTSCPRPVSALLLLMRRRSSLHYSNRFSSSTV